MNPELERPGVKKKGVWGVSVLVIWRLGGFRLNQTTTDRNRLWLKCQMLVSRMNPAVRQQPAEVLLRQSELEAETVLSKDKWIGRAAD